MFQRQDLTEVMATAVLGAVLGAALVAVGCGHSAVPRPGPQRAPSELAGEEAPAQAPSGDVLPAAVSPASAYDHDADAQKRALDVFRAVCTGYCHSTSAQVQREAPYLFDCDWQHGGSDEEVFAVISVGLPDTQMQGFGGKLPDEDLWKLVSFLRVRSDCAG